MDCKPVIMHCTLRKMDQAILGNYRDTGEIDCRRSEIARGLVIIDEDFSKIKREPVYITREVRKIEREQKNFAREDIKTSRELVKTARGIDRARVLCFF